MHISTRFESSAEVRKIRLSQTIGVEPDGPGIGNRQATFSVLVHLAGMPVSVLARVFVVPRLCGQFSADEKLPNDRNPAIASKQASFRRIVRTPFETIYNHTDGRYSTTASEQPDASQHHSATISPRQSLGANPDGA